MHNEDINLETKNDANSDLCSETSPLPLSTSIVGTTGANPMIKFTDANLELAVSTEQNATFMPPTDIKDDSLIHNNTQTSTLTNDSIFEMTDQQSEPTVCAIREDKAICLDTKPALNKTNEAQVETEKN